MIIKKKNIIQILLLAVATTFVACNKTPGEHKGQNGVDTVDISKVPSMIGDDVNSLVSDSGRIKYKMVAPKLAIYDKAEEPYWYFPEGVHMTTYNKNGEDEGDIKSDYAIYYSKKELWELRKNVVALNTTKDSKLTTETLYWDQKAHLIYSDTVATATKEGIRTTGTGFKSDESFEEWEWDNSSSEIVMDE